MKKSFKQYYQKFKNIILRLWHIDKFTPYKLIDVKNPLPSDSNYRKDCITLSMGDNEKAQVIIYKFNFLLLLMHKYN